MDDKELVLELPNDVRTIEHAVDYVMERCEVCNSYAHRVRFNFRLGLIEALSNAMLYGNLKDPQKRVRVEVSIDLDSITACVTDQGEGFDPAGVPDPTSPANIVRPGGRGIFLMRSLLDDVVFNERGNSVTLVLRLNTESGFSGGASA